MRAKIKLRSNCSLTMTMSDERNINQRISEVGDSLLNICSKASTDITEEGGNFLDVWLHMEDG